ncbi:hypothetical protein NN561_015562 [Cricetulus griseus]
MRVGYVREAGLRRGVPAAESPRCWPCGAGGRWDRTRLLAVSGPGSPGSRVQSPEVSPRAAGRGKNRVLSICELETLWSQKEKSLSSCYGKLQFIQSYKMDLLSFITVMPFLCDVLALLVYQVWKCQVKHRYIYTMLEICKHKLLMNERLETDMFLKLPVK